jgi:integrase
LSRPALPHEPGEKARPALIYPFLYNLAWTGMRSDEARTLRWAPVNFEIDEIVVGKAKTEAAKEGGFQWVRT